MQYCCLCFGVGQKCGCSSVPHQTPSQASALRMPPMMSYMAMASSTETTASSSVARVTPPRYPPPGLPPLEPMDTLPAPTSENLLATAGVSRGGRGRSQPSTPTAPGIHQMRPTAPQQWMRTPGRQETNQVTPYWQQVYPPRCTTPKPSTAPSTSQGHEETAREVKMPGVGPHPEVLKADTGEIDLLSTRGSRKC